MLATIRLCIVLGCCMVGADLDSWAKKSPLQGKTSEQFHLLLDLELLAFTLMNEMFDR
jgi:hypothetical protein